MKGLELNMVVPVAHDASGTPAIDWVLNSPEHVAGLVLLNTYYCSMPTLRPPEAIWLYMRPVIRNVTRFFAGWFNHARFRRIYWWQVGSFFRDAAVREQFLPLLYQQFNDVPSTRPSC